MNPVEIFAELAFGGIGLIFAAIAAVVGAGLIWRWARDRWNKSNSYGYEQSLLHPIVGLVLVVMAYVVALKIQSNFQALATAMAVQV